MFALVFLQSLDGFGLEGATLEVARKKLLLRLDLIFRVAIFDVVVSPIGRQGVSR